MKLKNNFFEVSKLSEEDIEYTIKLNPHHYIYEAHFPNNPVTPGVCIVQIAKELVEDYLKTEFKIKKIGKVKYSNIISPISNPEIVFKISIDEMENDGKKISATVYDADTIFTKMSLELQKI